MDKLAALTPNAIENARALFDTGYSDAKIARTLDVHTSTFARWRRIWGWPDRAALQDGVGAEASVESREPAVERSASADPASDENFDTLRLLRGVRKAVAHELANLGDGRTGEARARTLASLTRTLDVLRSVEGQIQNDRAGLTGHDDADEPPVDVAELRRELARRLDRMRRAREPS